jgi:hypothetical protein
MIFNRWPQQLAQTLVSGQLTPIVSAHLDDLLLWLSHPDHVQVAPLALALDRTGLTRATAARHAYSLLDQLLFSGPIHAPSTLGLAPNTPPERAKHRYRRLIQVYHPDRHAARPLWATQRTERINLAFNAHRRGTHGWTARSNVPTPTAAAPHSWRRYVPRSRWQQLGLALGVIGVLSGSGLLFIATAPPRPPRIIITPPPSATAPQPVPAAPPAELAEIVTAPPPIAALPAPAPAPVPTPPPVAHERAEIAPAAATPAPPNVAPTAVVPQLPASEPSPAAPLAPPLTIALPTAPTPPQTQSPAAVAAPAVTAPQLDCTLVPAQLQRFQHAYDAGDLTQLMALYSADARENDLENWATIQKTYAEWFIKTTQRRMQFTKLHIKQTNTHCAAVVLYQVRYNNEQQHITTQTGLIEFLFEQRSTTLHILRVRY